MLHVRCQPSLPVILFTAGVAASLAAGSAAGAQDAAGGAEPLPPVGSLVASAQHWRFTAGYEWQDDTAITSGGRIGIHRGDIDLGFRTPVESFGGIAVDLDYDANLYYFKGPSAFSDTWEEVHQFALSATIEMDLNNDWTFFGGPIVRYSGEAGADFGTSMSYGAFAGGSWSPSDDLTIGLGLAFVDDIEDDVRVIPMVRLNWEFTSGFSLRAMPTSFNTGATELQLAWEVDRDFEVAAGLVLNSRRRFRLDDDGAVADGVGMEDGRWIYLRGRWVLADDVDLTLSIGAALDPDLWLGDSRGLEITERDYDQVFAIGATMSVRF